MGSTSAAAPSGRDTPRGLCGWLWPFDCLIATLPVLFTATVGASLYGELAVSLRERHFPYRLDAPWQLHLLGVRVWLTLMAWWWASYWFARDPRLPRRGPVLLAASALVVATAAWIDHDFSAAIGPVSTLLVLAFASAAASRWSIRVCSTLSDRPTPQFAAARTQAMSEGPQEWSHWRWLQSCALFCAAYWLWHDIPLHAHAALAPIPPAPSPIPRMSAGTAAALAALAHPGRYIEASRVALTFSCIAAATTVVALSGLLLRARWASWATFLVLACGAAAAGWMTFSDWCCPFFDGPPYAHMWRQWCIALLLLLFGLASTAMRPGKAPDLAAHHGDAS